LIISLLPFFYLKKERRKEGRKEGRKETKAKMVGMLREERAQNG